MKTKLLKIALCAETAVLLLLSVCFALSLVGVEKTELLRETSPDGTYTLLIQELGEPDWPFGADHLRVSLYETANPSSYRASFSADVANDGGRARYEIEWLEDGVCIALSGEEQPTACYILPFEAAEDGER